MVRSRDISTSCFENCYPAPFVFVPPIFAFAAMKSMIWPAMSLPLAASIPSSPGEEFTSMITGPWLDRSMSTPHTFNPMRLAAATAVERSVGVILISSALPPR